MGLRLVSNAVSNALQQGSDLIDLRLILRETENLKFEENSEKIEDFLESVEEFWSNWFVVRRLRPFFCSFFRLAKGDGPLPLFEGLVWNLIIPPVVHILQSPLPEFQTFR